MIKKFVINHQESQKTVTVEKAVYQDRHVYEIGIDGQFFTLYQQNGKWHHDQELEMSDELMQQLTDHISTGFNK